MYQEVNSWYQNNLARSEINQIIELKSNLDTRAVFPVTHSTKHQRYRRSNSVPQTRSRITKLRDSMPYNNQPIQRQLVPRNRSRAHTDPNKSIPKHKEERPPIRYI